MKWFRLYTEARNDAKLRSLTDEQFRVWFNLLCFAAEQPEERGTIAGYDLDLLAVEVAGGDTDLLSTTLDRLQRLRMVAVDDAGTVEFIHFNTRQYDKPSDTPAATAERKRRQRERERAQQERDTPSMEEPVTPVSRDVTPSHATESEEEADTDSDVETTPDPNARARVKAVPRPEALDTADALKQAPWIADSLDDVAAAVERIFTLVPDFNPRDGPYLAEKFVRYRVYAKKPPADWYRAFLNWAKKELSYGSSNSPATQRAAGAPAARGGHRGQPAGPAEDYDAVVGLTGNGR